MRPAAFLTLLFSLAGSTLAKVYIYKPVGSSHYQPGDSFTVSWRDDGMQPSWEEWGLSTIGLYTGSATSQTLLTTLGTISDPSKSSEHLITIDGQWGGNSSDYFIRIESTSSQNPETDDPLQGFSARFTLSGMTGKFSEEVEAQLAGATGATASTSSATKVGGEVSATGRMTTAGAEKGAVETGSLATRVVASSTSASLAAAAASQSVDGTSDARRTAVRAGRMVALAAVAAVAFA